MMSDAAAAAARADDDEVAHDFSPILVVYSSGRLERPLDLPLVAPGHDAATDVVSKDVTLSPSCFVRLYLPPAASAGKRLPMVVYFHGGALVIGSAASGVYHRSINDLAAACPAVVVSVDYRVAPEHPVPASYEDSLAALEWALSSIDPWLAAHADRQRVFLAGDSAGGNICHHLAMHPGVRDVGLTGIVLIHPWFLGKQPIDGEPRRNAVHNDLWEFICPGAVDGVNDPRINPIAAGAPGLENLACGKVLVCVAERDELRCRGKAYTEAAARARGPDSAVDLFESEGVGHVFYLLDPAPLEKEKGKELLHRIAAFVSAE